MILIVFNYFLPKGYRGMTLFPFVFLAVAADKNDVVFLNHERIHLRQQLELLILPFYAWYLIEYLFRLVQFRNRKKAYYAISFEREAYENEKDLDYLKRRSFWRFLFYMK
jgi:hypothetical protein